MWYECFLISTVEINENYLKKIKVEVLSAVANLFNDLHEARRFIFLDILSELAKRSDIFQFNVLCLIVE